MKFNLALVVISALFSSNLSAQTNEKSVEHDHHKNEIGIANAPVYFVKEQVFSYGLHVHYIRNIPNSKFGIGFGFEKIFDAHNHKTFGLVTTYRITDEISLNLSPGLTFEDGNSKGDFALHIETSYEFELSDFHIGPVLEFAYDPEDIHISLGLHVGYGF